MCLYPKALKNPRYLPNKKNNYIPPPITDERLLYVQIPCRHCMECRKQRANEWRLRVIQELQNGKPAHMVTLTISTENLGALTSALDNEDHEWGYSLDNSIAKLAINRFLGRWRKKYKQRPRHWLISELGQTNTEHLHFHGIIWTPHPERINELWQYGFTWLGKYVGERTANYCVKYMLKPDDKHPNYKPQMYASKGIGREFLNTPQAYNARYNGTKTKQYATTRTGHKIYLPPYYRNKLYTDQQKEQLWIDKLNTNRKTVLGVSLSTSTDYALYTHAIATAQAKNSRLGYLTPKELAKTAEAEQKAREQIQRQRLDNSKKTS